MPVSLTQLQKMITIKKKLNMRTLVKIKHRGFVLLALLTMVAQFYSLITKNALPVSIITFSCLLLFVYFFYSKNPDWAKVNKGVIYFEKQKGHEELSLWNISASFFAFILLIALLVNNEEIFHAGFILSNIFALLIYIAISLTGYITRWRIYFF